MDASFHDIAKRGSTPAKESLDPVWGDHFPLLMQALFPAPGKATGTWATPRYSVTAFSEGCRLKCVVGAKGASHKFWLTLDGPEAILEQIELALKSGAGEWREAKDQD